MALRSSVEERQSGMSWTKDGWERSGLRRRGMGSAMGVGVWEGMAAGDYLVFVSFFGGCLILGGVKLLRVST